MPRRLGAACPDGLARDEGDTAFLAKRGRKRV